MLGRAAYHNPFLLREINTSIFKNEDSQISREIFLEEYLAKELWSVEEIYMKIMSSLWTEMRLNLYKFH